MWKILFIPEAMKDLKHMDNNIKHQVLTGINKVGKNPLPKREGGYGNPLGNIKGHDLTGFFKIKYQGIGIRVVYALKRSEMKMIIIVISARANDQSYKEAQKRNLKYMSDFKV
ncbi:MAG: type II toxin-antitoxin system RelE/ParE family toxin [Clostridia bacterium]|nr:type II toxin-antitoxin system RelE/ParE family toxin [Clostridia bacterium]